MTGDTPTASSSAARQGLAALCLLLPLAAAAQPFPSKPIRLIVAYPAGGPNDLSARTFGQKVADLLGQPVIVENRAGAAGNIGSQFVARSPADGYTLLNGASALTIAPALSRNLGYEVAKDFAPVGLTAISSFVLAVHPSVPATSIRELLALARKRPGGLNYASSGVGAPPHLAGELLKTMAGVDILHVPYKGVGQSIGDLVGGQVDMMFTSPPNAVPHVKQGRLRALAVSTARRSALLPEVPTIAESGLKGFDIGTWFGWLAPAGTPPEIVNRLNGALAAAEKMPDLRERLVSQGMDPTHTTPAAFAALIRSELAKFAGIVERAKIPPE
ncbi:MAG: tripartite tricarboxylate transporter substrate binding protein [Rhodocyclaceae bacterium]|jgi:tripartite-type tricarboxylate transporter receptor subunit TctC|nr:tripartite tricarboxylate transporter substrate binding protein [Rhodocyclaceae bacterium]MCA3075767.1 tripartite tricarboxylate transporter substrate binding protein [Rhodocyclaceae bacterium]MCA3091548.1 tripartite tricarboxylate transporter substrate binding protein [Rhodocyclaceae bacterium]MCA3094070.1 tripartite tricarboxylate transporter substrate binding protein [Rhodocyclaceae bacterium]MCA3099139.1 tripartite tricarboxylate transporter substrate binding protein [Rhodocyclaceae bact